MGTRGASQRGHGGTASAVVLRPIVGYAATRGVETAALLAAIGIHESSLSDPDTRVPDAIHELTWHEAAARSGDPVFGLHVAENTAVGAYDVLEYALRFSATLHAAFLRLSTFYRLLCDSLATTVEVQGASAHVRRTCADHGSHSAVCFLAWLVRRARDLAGSSLKVREVRFAHPAPPDVAPHAAFFGCPVVFGAAASEIVFDAKDFSREVHVPAPGLADVLDRYMRDLLARLPAQDSLTNRVHHAIASTLRQRKRPSLDATARALKASPRTVQRWLGERGATHRKMVDDVRRDLAVDLLEKRHLSITEIAFLLGFSEVSGFERTFKRWTGKTPSSVRSRSR